MVPAPSILLTPFANDAAGANITFPIPVDPTVTPGQASLSLGFPPVTMADPVSAAGVPPYGQDFNGIFKMITAYLVWIQGGGGFFFDQDFSDEYSGYAEGSVLRSTVDATRQWVSTTDNNTTDPDSISAANWIPVGGGQGYLSVAVAAGTTHNWAPAGFGSLTDVLDVNTSAGDATVTGLTAGYNGQRIVVTNVGANTLILSPTGSSSPANQFRTISGGAYLLQNMTIELQYNNGVGKWLVMP